MAKRQPATSTIEIAKHGAMLVVGIGVAFTGAALTFSNGENTLPGVGLALAGSYAMNDAWHNLSAEFENLGGYLDDRRDALLDAIETLNATFAPQKEKLSAAKTICKITKEDAKRLERSLRYSYKGNNLVTNPALQAKLIRQCANLDVSLVLMAQCRLTLGVETDKHLQTVLNQSKDALHLVKLYKEANRVIRETGQNAEGADTLERTSLIIQANQACVKEKLDEIAKHVSKPDDAHPLRESVRVLAIQALEVTREALNTTPNSHERTPAP